MWDLDLISAKPFINDGKHSLELTYLSGTRNQEIKEYVTFAIYKGEGKTTLIEETV